MSAYQSTSIFSQLQNIINNVITKPTSFESIIYITVIILVVIILYKLIFSKKSKKEKFMTNEVEINQT